jgi:hypothetical protein
MGLTGLGGSSVAFLSQNSPFARQECDFAGRLRELLRQARSFRWEILWGSPSVFVRGSRERRSPTGVLA